MERLPRISQKWFLQGAMIALFFFACGASAQDISGNWQGTVQDLNIRVLLKVQKTDAGGWKGVLVSVDQENNGRALTSIGVEGGTVVWSVPAIETSYEGKLSADGNSITGTLLQAGTKRVLNLVHTTPETEWKVQETKRMAKDAAPSFEVATIKPTDPTNGRMGFHSGNGRKINCDGETAANIVQFAYGIHPKQIVGAPQWFFEQRWDVDGYPDVAGVPDYKQMQGMYAKLLTDRFGLKAHREKRSMGAYVLTVAKGGPKLAKSVDQEAMSDTTYLQWNSQRRVLRVTSTTMAEFAMTMNFDMQKPVVDQTGLTGKWDFLLKWRPDDAPDTGDPNALPGLFTAIQEQAGLKMESVTSPIEVMVLDGVERPGEN